MRTEVGWEKSQGVEMFFLEELGVKIRIRIAPHMENQCQYQALLFSMDFIKAS